MDLLESGREQRAPGELRARLAAVAGPAVALGAVAVLAAGAAAVSPVREREDRTRAQEDRTRAQEDRTRAQAAAERAARPDLAARPLGGVGRSDGRQASGVLGLEVRNGGPALALLSLDAQVPGAVVQPVTYSGGRSLGPDDRLELRLAFTVPDCPQLRAEGRLLLRVQVRGAEQLVVIGLTAQPTAPQPGEVDATLLLRACG